MVNSAFDNLGLSTVSGLGLPSSRLRAISSVGSIPAVRMAAISSRCAIFESLAPTYRFPLVMGVRER
jgi:hypothetical protein